jgi:hypothetical protein
MTAAVISTGHISQGTANWLDACDPAHWPVSGMRGPYGWMLYCNPEAADDTCPDDLRKVIDWGVTHGFHWVRLDQDADPAEGLATYDW